MIGWVRVGCAALLCIALTGCDSAAQQGGSVWYREGSEAAQKTVAGLVKTPAPTSGETRVESAGSRSGGTSRRMLTLYEAITLDDTYNDIVKKYGEGTPTKNRTESRYYKWTKDGGSVRIAFFEDGRISSKSLAYESAKDLAGFCAPVDKKAIDKLEAGMSMSQVERVLGGSGVETAIQRMSASKNDKSLQRVLVWCNSDGSYIMCVFNEKENLLDFKAM